MVVVAPLLDDLSTHLDQSYTYLAHNSMGEAECKVLAVECVIVLGTLPIHHFFVLMSGRLNSMFTVWYIRTVYV